MPTRREKRQWTAMKNRQELIGLSRRELFKVGLLTTGGYLVAKDGLSTRAAYGDEDICISPPTRAFIELLPTPRDGTMPIQTPLVLSPAPTAAPNTAAGEGRTITHQAFTTFPPQKFYAVTQKAGAVSVSPDLPLQTLWGFAVGTPAQNNPITSPGPLYVARYGEPILVRNFNQLPPPNQNGGFGLPSVTTHLHNGHTPSESDGNPCDFFERGFFYDQHYPNVLAGVLSDHQPTGDINEAMSTLWYHDHRVDFTAQNVYKGLAGFYLLFNQFDTGDEGNGFHLPSFPQFDIPMMFADKCFDRRTGLLFFDLFNLDGILGDKFLVNGKIQPVLHVSPRRYRFRWLDAGPSRFYQFFLTDLNNLNAHNLFWQISSDGNLLPKPFQVESVRLSVAERADVIIDFAPFAGKTLYLENRLQQTDGRGPTDHVVRPAGQGDRVLQIIVDGPRVADGSANPATIAKFYDLPSTAATPRVRRTFVFSNSGGGWQINGQFFDCNDIRFTVQENSVEQWTLINDGGGWEHPIHIHFEEFQTLSINGRPPATSPLVQIGRKDVLRLEADASATLFFRFRDFLGKYPMHCHNTVHEDHAMMLRFDIAPIGDTRQKP
jgi:FtsP/CotA-like multicopper oxidase with cupredoxin domain